MRWLELPKKLFARRSNFAQTAGAEEPQRVCRACGQPMEFLREFEREVARVGQTITLTPGTSIRHHALENQITVCEHCGQVHVFVLRRHKLKMKVVTDRWMRKQTPEDRASVVVAVENAQKSMHLIEVTKKWKEVFHGNAK